MSADAVSRVGYLGLGSNVGDSAANLRAAADALDAAGVKILARAAIYVTAPQGEVLDQPDFMNSALKVETQLEPLDLLDLCKRIERELGRDPDGRRHGPRPIDIDVLLLGEQAFESDRLTLPHREIATRRFVLQPLLEIEPDLALPDGTRIDSLADAVADQPVRRIEPL
ncbi:MAG: 2-amino-4-hydroxy-6-hydroxymethyldihydropteridine diphosphokinase [Solirubrobacterales bacterium]